jgi:SnoaL-like domain
MPTSMDGIAKLLVEHACEELIYEYCRRVDFGNAGQIADLFTEDAQWQGTDLLLAGREQIRAWFVRREGVTRRVSRHVCTNVMVTVLSEDEAESVCYMINYRHDRREGDDSLPVPAEVPKYVGELRDRFRRTPDGWRFARRQVDVAFLRRRADREAQASAGQSG